MGVVVPVYNAEKTIKRCLDSIFNNKFDNFLVCCINDFSKDNSEKILKCYEEQNRNKMVCLNNNGSKHGPSVARNLGIRYLKNKVDYIVFVDSDDFVDVNYFQTMFDLITKSNVDAVCTSFYFSHENRDKPFEYLAKSGVYSGFESASKLLEDVSLFSQCWAKIFKISLWDNIEFPEEIDVFEDYCTIYKIFLNANKILIANYCGYHYWLSNNDSLLRSKLSNKKIFGMFDACVSVCENVKYDKTLWFSAFQFASKTYLMMLPRITKNDFDNSIKKAYKKYFRAKILKYYKPLTKIEKKKKIAYCFGEQFYIFLYKHYLKNI